MSIELIDLQEDLWLRMHRRRKNRVVEILGRFVTETDDNLSDKDFILAVIQRWQNDRDSHIVDVNE